MKRTHIVSLLALILTCAAPAFAQAPAKSVKQPLHKRIDAIIESASIGGTTALASDADFVRRVYLDLTGRIPTAQQARVFLDNKSKQKRAQLLDELLRSPLFSIHMARSFDIMLMERRGNKHVTVAEWETYLRSAFDKNKPFNVLAAEILGADGVDAKKRAAVRFYLDRDAEVNRLTRDVGRMFFGIDLQCAQCHNHPLIDDYLQSDYYGIYAFLSRSYQYKTKKMKRAVLAEKAEGGVNFTSVFTKLQGEASPRLPGDLAINEPQIDPAKKYLVKPAKNVRPVPRYSRRARLAKLITSGANRAFRRNISNRLWAMVMGRGLVEPVDLHHSQNPSSHPQLTEILADEFAAMNYDVRAFLRQVMLSRSYQRSIEMPQDLLARAQAATKQVAQLKKVHAEREKVSKADLDKFNTTDSAHSELVKKLVPLLADKRKATAAIAAANKAFAAANKAAGSLEQALAQKQKLATLLSESAAKAIAAAKLRPQNKALADVSRRLQGQAGAAQKAAAALAKTATPKIKAKRAAVARQQAANKKDGQINKRLADIRGKISQAYTKVNDARRRWQHSNAEATFAERRVDAAEELAEYAQVEAARRSAVNAFRAADSKVKRLAADVKVKTDQLVKLTAQRDRSLKRMQKDMAQLKKLTAARAAKAKIQPLLREATDKTAAALKLVPGSEKLKAALEDLKKQSAAVAAELKSLAIQIPLTEKNVATAKVDLAKLAKSVPKLQSELKPTRDQYLKLKSATASLQRKVQNAQAAWEKHYMFLTESWANRFAVAPLSPLSPEQLAWSMMRASGMEQQQRQSSLAAIVKKNKKKPLPAAEQARQVEGQVHSKLKGNVGEFVKLFSPGAGQPQNQFFATPDQALFLANGSRVRGWFARGGGLVAKLAKMTDNKKLCEEMYLAVFSRRPTIEEFADITQYLAKADKKARTATIREIVWSLVASAEFRFNH